MSFPNVLMLGCHSLIGNVILELMDFSQVTGVDCLPEKTSQPRMSTFIQHDLAQGLNDLVVEKILDSKIILIAVPFDCFEKFSRQFLSILRIDVVLIDVFSVKMSYFEMIKSHEELENKKISLLSLNPLFRPDTHLPNRKILLFTYGCHHLITLLVNKLSLSSEVVKLANPEEHDSAMAVVQVAPHFLMLVLSVFLRNTGFSCDQIQSVKTTFMDGVFVMLSRLLCGEPHVYWEIQASNSCARKVRDQIKEIFAQLDEVVNQGDSEEFFSTYNGSKSFLKNGSFCNKDFFKLLMGENS